MCPQTHTDDVEILVEHAHLQVEKTNEKTDLSPNHANVLVTLAVQIISATGPVNADDVCIFLCSIYKMEIIMMEELQRKNEHSIELVKISDSISKCVDTKRKRSSQQAAVDRQPTYNCTVKVGKIKEREKKKKVSKGPRRKGLRDRQH